jgi:glycosyltransferase involved in cell wall biosynthesis
MYIWIISVYEPLPVGDPNVRAMRNGMLADALSREGHDVQLWIPGFDHVHHEHHYSGSILLSRPETYSLQILGSLGYKTDQSITRLFHNILLAREFTKIAAGRKRIPDIVLTQIPSLELADAVVQYSQSVNIPVMVDIRDLWPDVYERLFPSTLRFLYPLIFSREVAKAKRILKQATSITAVSETYLRWGLAHADRQRHNSDMVFHIGSPRLETPEKIGESDLELFNLPAGKLVVLFVGTFCDSYEIDIIFKAADYLSCLGTHEIHFVIAGRGDGEESIERHSNESDYVSYLGWLDRPALQKALGIATVGICPYSKGALMSLPNKPFEYLSAGLPIISSLEGELATLISTENVGQNYVAGDFKSLANCLMNLTEQEILKQGTNAKMLYEKSFVPKTIYGKFVKHIEGLVASSKRSGSGRT